MSDVKVARGPSEDSEEAEDIFASNFTSSTGKVKIAGSENHFEQQAAAIEASKKGEEKFGLNVASFA
jgi:hypothetical protein